MKPKPIKAKKPASKINAATKKLTAKQSKPARKKAMPEDCDSADDFELSKKAAKTATWWWYQTLVGGNFGCSHGALHADLIHGSMSNKAYSASIESFCAYYFFHGFCLCC